MVIFRDYAPPNLRRFVANIGSVTREKLRTTENGAIAPASDSSEVKMLILLFAVVHRYFHAIFRGTSFARRHLIFRKRLSTLGKMMPRGNDKGGS